MTYPINGIIEEKENGKTISIIITLVDSEGKQTDCFVEKYQLSFP